MIRAEEKAVFENKRNLLQTNLLKSAIKLTKDQQSCDRDL